MNYPSTPPIGLDTWGLDPLDYRLNQDLRLMRRYPSPLTHFGLGSNIHKQKKVINILKHHSFTSFRSNSRILSYRIYPVSRPLPLVEMELAVLSRYRLVNQHEFMFLILSMRILKELVLILRQNFNV